MRHEAVDEEILNQYPPLVLAYIGDAVYELMVRRQVISNGPRRLKELHRLTVDRVNAEHQARVVRAILPDLSPAEQDLVRRGRNTRSQPPKNADVNNYRLSTGLETLLGYLYLKGDLQRLDELFRIAGRISEE